ncbi:transposable element Tcb2 transposase [Trichonephila clavipes]|nr:transposable element Tcb2 transposase [Trichonephila clavipes]
MSRSDATIRRRWQEWVDRGRFQLHEGSGRPTATEDRQDRLIVRSAVTALDSSLLNIRRTTRTRVSTMDIHRWLIERNLHLYRPFRHLPFTPAHCSARLQWCLNRSGWNHADWGEHRYVNGLLRTVLVPLFLQYSGLIFQQDNAKPNTPRIAINCLTSYKMLSWPARLPNPFPIENFWNMMRRRLHLPGNVNDLARQLEQIWLEIPQETIRVLYPFMSLRVAACIQPRGASTPY